MNHLQLRGESIRETFENFHSNNPEVYIAFEAQALEAVRLGKTKASSKQILGYIRWNMFLDIEHTDTYKINDSFTSYYAREFAKNHPDYAGIFNYRELRNESN